jgi:hypothetical protein
MHSGRLKALGCMHDPSIARTMLETDVRSTLLFGAAIWGHFHIQRRDPMTHPMQKAYSTIARQSMGLPHGTAHWTVAFLFGLMPIQHWILRDFCRFWNSLLLLKQTHSLLNLAVQQQVLMLQHNRKCMLGRWTCVLNKVLPTHPFHYALSSMQPIDEHSLLAALQCTYHDILASAGDPSVHPCPQSRIAHTYNNIHPLLRWQKRPQCMHLFAPRRIKQTWIAFWAGACTLVPVNDYNHLYHRPHPNAQPVKVPYHHVTCTKCTLGEVADESHVVLRCPSTLACRHSFAAQYTLPSSLRAFLCTHHSNQHAAFFIHRCVHMYSAAPVLAARQHMPARHTQPRPAPQNPPAPTSPTTPPTSSITAHMGSLPPSQYDSESDIESEDPITHVSRRTENQSLLYRARMLARMGLRRIQD